MQWLPGLFPGGKAAGSSSWPFTCTWNRGQEWVELYLNPTDTSSWRKDGQFFSFNFFYQHPYLWLLFQLFLFPQLCHIFRNKSSSLSTFPRNEDCITDTVDIDLPAACTQNSGWHRTPVWTHDMNWINGNKSMAGHLWVSSFVYQSASRDNWIALRRFGRRWRRTMYCAVRVLGNQVIDRPTDWLTDWPVP